MRIVRLWEWYRSNFLAHYLAYPFLPVILLVLVAMMTKTIGEGYGIYQLFTPAGFVKGMFIGLTLALLVVEVQFVGYLLWLRDRRLALVSQRFERIGFWTHFVRIAACMAATVGLVTLLMFAISWAINPPRAIESWGAWSAAAIDPMKWDGVWPVLLGAALALAGLWVAHSRCRGLSRGLRIRMKCLCRRIARCFAEGKCPPWWLVWPARVSLIALWLLLLRLSEPGDDHQYGWAFVLIGLVFALAAMFGSGYRPLFVTALVAYAAVIYTGCAWLTSGLPGINREHIAGIDRIAGLNLLVGLAVPLVPLLIGLLVVFAHPPGVSQILTRDPVGVPRPNVDERRNRLVAVWAGLLGWMFFVVVCTVPAFASAATVGGAFFCFLVAVYGTIAYLFPKGFSAGIIILLILGLLGGIHKYRFRYDPPESLNQHYVGDPVDLEDRKSTDVATLKAANPRLTAYLDLRDEIPRLEGLVEPTRHALAAEENVWHLVTGFYAARQAVEPPDGDFHRLREQLASDMNRLAAARGKLRQARQDAVEALDSIRSQNTLLLGGQFNTATVILRQDQEAAARAAGGLLGGGLIASVDGTLLKPRPPLEVLRVLADPTVPAGPAALLSPEDIRFRSTGWLTEAANPEQRRKPLIIVCVSGGGLTAAAWTLTVLNRLEQGFAEDGKDFPAHVRLITGASGGMLGASYYVSELADHRVAWGDRWPEHHQDRMDDFPTHYDQLTGDHLTPLMRQFVFGDIGNFFSPWSAQHDRGEALEQAWSRNMGGALDRPVRSLYPHEVAGWCPSLVFTPMMVEDGRRLIISNLELYSSISNSSTVLRGESAEVDELLEALKMESNLSVEAVQMFRLFPRAWDDFRLSTAVRMNASFPYFSPAVSLPTSPRRRVVDAGYYDNYGTSFAAAWLVSNRNHDWLKANVSKVAIVQIRADVQEEKRNLREFDPDGSTHLSRWLEELTSPPEALDNARIASTSFGNDGLLEQLTKYMNDLFGEAGVGTFREPTDPIDRSFAVVNFEFSGRSSLNWYLSERERAELRLDWRSLSGDSREDIRQLDQAVERKIDRLIEFLFRRNDPDPSGGEF